MFAKRCLGWGFAWVLGACAGGVGQEVSSEREPSSATVDAEQGDSDLEPADAGTDRSDAGPSIDPPDTEVDDPGEYDAGSEAPEPLLPVQVPAGFAINVFATDTGDSRSLTTHAGHVYAARSLEGDILRLSDADGDGVAEQRTKVAECFEGVHGLVFHENTAFFATPSSLYRAHLDAEGNFDEPVAIFKDLPSGGLRPKHALVIDESQLYLSTGSSCEACVEQNAERASIVRTSLDGSARTVVARGLRNPLGIALQPGSRVFWSLDTHHAAGQAIRTLELNLIESGRDYGWPYCFGNAQIEASMVAPSSESAESYCTRSTLPALVAEVDAEPVALVFAQPDSLPAPYAGGAFVTLRGTRQENTASKVMFIAFENGAPESIHEFATPSVAVPNEAPVSLSGLTVANDGSLLVADDVNGLIYRIRAL